MTHASRYKQNFSTKVICPFLDYVHIHKIMRKSIRIKVESDIPKLATKYQVCLSTCQDQNFVSRDYLPLKKDCIHV